MSRLAQTPIAIEVEVIPVGVPKRITWDGKTHEIEIVNSHQRVTDEWWARFEWRDYFEVYTDTKLLLLIFYDKNEHQWFLQRRYD